MSKDKPYDPKHGGGDSDAQERADILNSLPTYQPNPPTGYDKYTKNPPKDEPKK